MKDQKQRGRPPKERYESTPNSADASLPRITAYTAGILRVMAHEPQFAPAFQKVSAHNQALLAEKLAYETAFTPAMQGLTDMAQRSKTGPRPQTALRLFVTEVRLALEAYGVKLPQWKNGRGERTDLADFCNRLLKMSGERAALISVRTMSGAPAQGFTNGIDTP